MIRTGSRCRRSLRPTAMVLAALALTAFSPATHAGGTATEAQSTGRATTRRQSPTPPAVRGAVTDRATGAPVVGAVVALPQWGRADTTGADGTFRIDSLPAGLSVIMVTHRDYADEGPRSVRLTRGAVARVDRALERASGDATAPAACFAIEGIEPAAGDGAEPVTDRAPVRVRWSPTRPVEGTIAEVIVEPAVPGDSIVAVEAKLAGEALHFERDPQGRFRSLAAVPIGQSGALELDGRAVLARGPATTLAAAIAVADGSYRLERLSVAPRFGREPDAALARRIAAEGALARAVSVRSHLTPRLWREPFLVPRESRVTSGFGHGREFNGTVQSRHMGVDFAGAVGTPVRVSNRGVVALVADFHLAGTAVYVDHGAGVVTGYFHLSRADVAIGDTVARGAVIGRVGQTGRVTGPHLHWIARYGATTVDPRSLTALGARRWKPRAC